MLIFHYLYFSYLPPTFWAASLLKGQYLYPNAETNTLGVMPACPSCLAGTSPSNERSLHLVLPAYAAEVLEDSRQTASSARPMAGQVWRI